jgi:hypothetical protein
MREPTSEEWERIETALGLTDQKPERREKILGTLEWVFHLQPREIFGPYIPETFTSEYRRAHLALKRQAKKARNVLDDADWRSADLDALISRIDDIAPDDDKGGRPTNWRLQASIHKLGEIYSRWTDRKPGISRDIRRKPGGSFFVFVSECLRVFAPELLKGDEALASAIRRSLKMIVRPTI